MLIAKWNINLFWNNPKFKIGQMAKPQKKLKTTILQENYQLFCSHVTKNRNYFIYILLSLMVYKAYLNF